MKSTAAQRPTRKTLLVGSIPEPDAESAVDLALSELGSTLMCIPDGETGARSQWVNSIITALRDHPDLIQTREGQWSDYDDRPHYRVRRGATLDPDLLKLGYEDAFRQSLPTLDAMASKYGLDSAHYQVGMASGFDLALLALGPVGAWRHRKPFNVAACREMRAIRGILDDRVVFQIEVPAELGAVSRAPGFLRPAMARLMARMCIEPAQLAPKGTQFGIHLCFGDLNHRALTKVGKDCAPTVQLANAIAARWPTSSTLSYMHIPLAAGNNPPSLDESYYAPLADLRLPEHTRVVAGFVHETPSPDQLRTVLGMIEAAYGRVVDVASPCGLGRCDTAIARDVLHVSRELTEG